MVNAYRRPLWDFPTREHQKSVSGFDFAVCGPINPPRWPFFVNETGGATCDRKPHFREPRMAGHSQFKNIMHRKGRQDAQRSKLFGKLAREITIAAKLGTPDPAMNPRLRLAISAARHRSTNWT